MKPSDDFFSGSRYAVFGVRARGRAHGPVLIAALRKAGKTAVAIVPDGSEIKSAEVSRTLAEAGPIDGAVLLPPTPWDESAALFTADTARQCREHGVTKVWIYTVGDASPAVSIVDEEGLDASAGKCPCLYIENGGFPHNFHRWIAKHLGRM